TFIAASQEELVALLNILEQHSAACGLGINYNKTKVMIVDRKQSSRNKVNRPLCSSSKFCVPRFFDRQFR
ncbi:unnamed protein product, partial [Callosobruchus maculatus]